MQREDLSEVFYRRTSRGLIYIEDLPGDIYRQKISQMHSVDRGQSMGLRRQKRGKKIFLEDLQGGKLGVLIFQAKKTFRSFSRRRRLHQKRLLEGFPGGERVFAVVSYGRKISKRYSAGRRPSKGLEGREDPQRIFQAKKTSKDLKGVEDSQGSERSSRRRKLLEGLPVGKGVLAEVFYRQKISQRYSVDRTPSRGLTWIEDLPKFFCRQNTFQRSSRALLRIENLAEVF